MNFVLERYASLTLVLQQIIAQNFCETCKKFNVLFPPRRASILQHSSGRTFIANFINNGSLNFVLYCVGIRAHFPVTNRIPYLLIIFKISIKWSSEIILPLVDGTRSEYNLESKIRPTSFSWTYILAE